MMLSRKRNTAPVSYEQALQRLASLCSQSEHSSAEIRQKAASWQLSPADTDRLVDYLTDERYIDDERYCKAYANDKLRYNHWGRFKIRQMLQFQGLASEHIRAGLESINDEEYKKILTEIILSKIRSLKDSEPYTRYAKVMRHATSKGFESDAIAKLLSECGENAQNE